MMARIIPVIMCGGAGTRLWPVSRESMPKQFVPLIGEQSTFQQVLTRIADPDLFARALVITKSDFRFVVAEQLREHGLEADIVLEPMPRDSGPAVAVAAVLAAERDPQALVLVLAADHVTTMLAEIERFEPAIAESAKAAVAGSTRDLDFLRLAGEPFAQAPKKSIDYAVMERTKLAAVMPADMGWSDIGSWSSVWDVLDHDV